MYVLLAHGSSDHRHGDQVRVLARQVSELLGEEVGTAFLGDEKLPEGAKVLPLFLGEGKHVNDDIPKLAAASDCILLPPLADQADAIASIAVDMLTHETRQVNAIFVLYRFGGFEKQATALYAQAGICSKHALASLHSEPSLSTVLEHWRDEGVESISLQPMLLFEGCSLARLQSIMKRTTMQISCGPVLSKHEAFLAMVADCFRELA